MRKFSVLIVMSLLVSCGNSAPKKQGSDNNTAPNNTTANNTTANNTTGSNNGTTNPTNNVTNPDDDDDGDGILNGADNCPALANTTQLDADGDQRGDVCDNCPDTANRDQADSNGDGIGDACPGDHFYQPNLDSDADGTADVLDNCRFDANVGQEDSDADGVGDVCDNCIDVQNADQTDTNGDGTGDSCSLILEGQICATGEAVDLSPDMWILYDNSGSIGSYPNELINGVNTFFNNHADDTRFGISAQTSTSGACNDTLFLELGDWNAANLVSVINNVQYSGGSTPNVGLFRVRSQDYLFDPADGATNSRGKAVVVISDGPGNSCDADVSTAQTTAAGLAAAGITVHTLGYQWQDPLTWLNEVAGAGNGLARTATTASGVTAALEEYRALLPGGPCIVPIDVVEDRNKIWVSVNGVSVSENAANGYTVEGDAVVLHGAACDQAQAGPVEVSLGCRVDCAPSAEICNYVDDDCNGVVDEGCVACSPEQCDGADNDCDGEIDEGC